MIDLNLSPDEEKRVRYLATESDSPSDLTKRLQDEFSWKIERAINVGYFMLDVIRNEHLLEIFRKGGQTTKYWRTGSNPCPACKKNRGQGLALDATFQSGDKLPPVHVGCRCVISSFPLT